MRLVIAIASLVIFLGWVEQAESSEKCSREMAYGAEMDLEHLSSWEKVYRFYGEFGHCLDGVIAGGVAERIQDLWANNWGALETMLDLAGRDQKFKVFLWSVLESEDFPQDTFDQVVRNATNSCPITGEEFCRAVLAAKLVPSDGGVRRQ